MRKRPTQADRPITDSTVWLKLLEEANTDEAIPPGALTESQLMDEWDVGRCAVRRKIKLLMDKGLIKREVYRTGGHNVAYFSSVKKR